jgi:hypothetical protein
VSLGSEAYGEALERAGLTLTGEATDEGDNHSYVAAKSPG